MLQLAIIMWMMIELSAPSWCYTLWWIMLVATVIKDAISLIELGQKLKE